MASLVAQRLKRPADEARLPRDLDDGIPLSVTNLGISLLVITVRRYQRGPTSDRAAHPTG